MAGLQMRRRGLAGWESAQDLCFSSPLLHASHVACHRPTLLLEAALGASGDPAACCPCGDPSRAAEPS